MHRIASEPSCSRRFDDSGLAAAVRGRASVPRGCLEMHSIQSSKLLHERAYGDLKATAACVCAFRSMDFYFAKENPPKMSPSTGNSCRAKMHCC